MGSNDLPPYAPTTPQRKPALIDVRHTRRYAGDPAAGAGSRFTSCGTGSSWADDEGSAGGGLEDGGGGGGVGSGDGVVRVGVGCGAAVVGPPGFGLVPGLGALVAVGLAAPPGALGEAEPEADSPGFGFPCPCFPSPAEPPNPIPPPGTPEPPSGASPAGRPAECEGLAPPPASSPTLIQPAAAATTATAAARRTGTYMGRTGPPPRAEKGSHPLNSRRPPEDTRRTARPPLPGRSRPVPDPSPAGNRRYDIHRAPQLPLPETDFGRIPDKPQPAAPPPPSTAFTTHMRYGRPNRRSSRTMDLCWR